MQVANQWLEEVKNRLCTTIFNEPTLAEKCHISYGFPSTRAFSGVLGEAWQQNGKEAIFVNPSLFKQDKFFELCAVLIHELIHIKVGVPAKHGKIFKKAMVETGLEGKPKATYPSMALVEQLKRMELPSVPELNLTKAEKEKKQTTRLILLECDCGRKVRMAKKTLEEGPIVCGNCNQEFVQKESEKE